MGEREDVQQSGDNKQQNGGQEQSIEKRKLLHRMMGRKTFGAPGTEKRG